MAQYMSERAKEITEEILRNEQKVPKKEDADYGAFRKKLQQNVIARLNDEGLEHRDLEGMGLRLDEEIDKFFEKRV